MSYSYVFVQNYANRIFISSQSSGKNEEILVYQLCSAQFLLVHVYILKVSDLKIETRFWVSFSLHNGSNI